MEKKTLKYIAIAGGSVLGVILLYKLFSSTATAATASTLKTGQLGTASNPANPSSSAAALAAAAVAKLNNPTVGVTTGAGSVVPLAPYIPVGLATTDSGDTFDTGVSSGGGVGSNFPTITAPPPSATNIPIIPLNGPNINMSSFVRQHY